MKPQLAPAPPPMITSPPMATVTTTGDSIRVLHTSCCRRPTPPAREPMPADVVLIAADRVQFVVNATVLFAACPALQGHPEPTIMFPNVDSHTIYALVIFLRFGSLDGLWDAHDIRDHWRHLSDLVAFLQKYEAAAYVDRLVAYFAERLEGVHILPPNYVVLAFLLGASLDDVSLCQTAIHRSWLPPVNELGLSLSDDGDVVLTLVPEVMPRTTEQLIPPLYRWALRRSWDKAERNQYWWGAYFSGMVMRATKRI